MKNLGHISTDKAELELIECDCGFHLAVDSTYIEQVAISIYLDCPACLIPIDFANVLQQEVET
jgi:hypothetical protein